MKLAAPAGLLVAVAFAACGNAAAVRGSGATTSSGGPPLAGPPPPGPPSAPADAGPATFAVTKLYLGDTDPDGTPDPMNGWRHYGYNVDGLPANATAVCKPNPGAPAGLREQGDDGLESSFGHNFLPTLLGISNILGSILNRDLADGGPTPLFTIDQLGAGSDYNPLTGTARFGAALGAPPKLDGTDVWPYAQGSSVSLPAGYLTTDTWVSGSPISVGSVVVVLAGPRFVLRVQRAVVSMKLDAEHRHASGGILSGVLSTADMQNQLRAILMAYAGTLCDPPTLQPIIDELGRVSDMMQDGTQDPTRTCDGISIGLGFEADLATLGAPVPLPPPPPVCP